MPGPRLALGAIALALIAPLAMAQEPAGPAFPPESPEVQEDAPQGVEAISVTGERLDATDVQDEAQAITAFTADDLNRANIVNIDSLQFNVPGLHVGQAAQQAIVTLRGVGTENASITGEPGVAFHVDGINFAQPSAARVAFFDLETLDVKRGPQGLLGGKNSTSGSINVVSNKPHEDYEVTGDVLMGNYDRVRARGAINLPLGEFAATRFAFFHEDRDGYLDNKLLSDSRDSFDADDFGLRTHLRLRPTETLDVLLTYNYYKQGGNGPQADLVPALRFVPCQNNVTGETLDRFSVMPIGVACTFEEISPARFDPATNTFFPQQIAFSPAIENADPRSIFVDFASSQQNRFWGWTGAVDWDVPALPLLGETHLKTLGGFQRSELDFSWDFDGTELQRTILLNERNADQHSAELQWSGTLAERLEWQLSGFYLRETGFRFLQVPNVSSLGSQISIFTNQETENSNYGAALHTTLNVTDDVRFQLGGRWVKDKKRSKLLRERRDGLADQDTFVGCTGSLGLAIVGRQEVPAVPNRWCSETFRGTSWGAVLDWRPFGGDHLVYGKIDRGYKSGGFQSGGRGEYEPEQIWAYALGTKSEFFDSRLQLNLEGFFYAYENMQMVVIDGTTLRTENTDTRMYGWDLEAKASPFAGLNLSAVVSFLKTETLDYQSLDPADVAAFEGDAGGATSTEIAEFNRDRLNERDRAEALAEEGRSALDFGQRTCFSSPSKTRSPQVPCGTITPYGGLDDFTGNDLSRAPKWKITLAAEYEIPLGDYGSLTPRVQYTWQDDTYYRVFNRDIDLQDDYHLTDVKLIWRSPEETWEAELFVTNVEDEAPKQNILVGPRFLGSPGLAWYGPPRYYGARVQFRY
jgi:iron complex outermembrane receptor protein